MHFLDAIILALAASSTTAFTLPDGLKDGIYIAHYDEEGREVHEPLTTFNNTIHDKRRKVPNVKGLSHSSLAKRGPTDDQFSCGCGYQLNHGDCDAAVADLEHQFNNGGGPNNCASIPKNYSWYSVRGTVVAFGCTGFLGDVPVVICGKEYADAMATVTGRCGWYTAGTMMRTYYEPDMEVGLLPMNGIALGYMTVGSGQTWCQHAEDDRNTKC